MNKERIGISGWGGISALGGSPERVWNRYQESSSLIRYAETLDQQVGALGGEEEDLLTKVISENRNYPKLDRSVLMAIYAATNAVEMAGWTSKDFGINIGSSRGATGLWEDYFQKYMQNPDQRLPVLTSPNTTLGNLSSWVAFHFQNTGPQISHSVTCSTALHALLNGMNWLESGRSKYFLVGGSEAPLTPFTVAQMKTLTVYTASDNKEYPCRPFDPDAEANTMALGEGAACFCLEKEPQVPLAWIDGVGYGREAIRTASSVSETGICYQKAMEMAWQETRKKAIDLIICHAPGTLKGDQAERRAIEKIFGKNIPAITSNKWKIGHTLGASGALSLEMALLMLDKQEIISIPYLRGQKPITKSIRRIMINASGFGGNAVSIIISKNINT